jgi:uncharacterized protein YdhG (YjbR/CyaY superfamily)
MNEVDTYIGGFPVEVQVRLREIRRIIIEIAPSVTERISYGIPTYGLNGKSFVHFAGYKTHIGFYPGADGIVAFIERLTDYKTSKGTVQFPLNKPLPLDLIREIISYHVERLSIRRNS